MRFDRLWKNATLSHCYSQPPFLVGKPNDQSKKVMRITLERHRTNLFTIQLSLGSPHYKHHCNTETVQQIIKKELRMTHTPCKASKHRWICDVLQLLQVPWKPVIAVTSISCVFRFILTTCLKDLHFVFMLCPCRALPRLHTHGLPTRVISRRPWALSLELLFLIIPKASSSNLTAS